MPYFAVVVDDDPSNLKAAERILSTQGYSVRCFAGASEMLEFVKGETPDIILLDLHMPEMDGFEALRRLKSDPCTLNIPVIFLTADDDSETETKALSAGAMDFLKKPFCPSVFLMRVQNTIKLMRLQNDLQKEVNRMTREIIREHEKNERLSLQIVQTLTGTIDAKDSYTRGHSIRVADYSKEIAKRAGYSERAQEEIYMMGLLHDVGKIGIPDGVINKTSRLNDEEYALIKTHPKVGFEILKSITEMPKLSVGARWHHERYDGMGYPDNLSGNDIPEEARIIAVADAYDAMSSRRSYHDVFSQEYIRSELEKGKGSQFDPRFADIMISMIAEDSGYNLREQTDPSTVKARITEEKKPDSPGNVIQFLTDAGMNPSMGMKYCMNDIEFYTEMLCDFVSGMNDRREKLEHSFANGDIDSYRIAVHSLKSVSKTIGADKLSSFAYELETAAKNNDSAFIEREHTKLIDMLTNTAEKIRTALNKADIQ